MCSTNPNETLSRSPNASLQIPCINNRLASRSRLTFPVQRLSWRPLYRLETSLEHRPHKNKSASSGFVFYMHISKGVKLNLQFFTFGVMTIAKSPVVLVGDLGGLEVAAGAGAKADSATSTAASFSDVGACSRCRSLLCRFRGCYILMRASTTQ